MVSRLRKKHRHGLEVLIDPLLGLQKALGLGEIANYGVYSFSCFRYGVLIHFLVESFIFYRMEYIKRVIVAFRP